MSKLDLQPAHLRIVVDLIGTYAPDADVFAFGSRVRGGSHDGSDLDLVMRNPENATVPHHGIAALRAALAESNLPLIVDLLDWSLIPESFQREIEREAILIHRAEHAPV